MVSEQVFAGPVRPASHVAFRRINTTGVLVHLQANDIYELNDTGARIWELLQTTASPADVVDQLVAEYGADRGNVEAAVVDLVRDLTRLGLVEL